MLSSNGTLLGCEHIFAGTTFDCLGTHGGIITYALSGKVARRADLGDDIVRVHRDNLNGTCASGVCLVNAV